MVLGIYGSGGAGKEVQEIAEELNKWEEIVFIDDTVPSDIYRRIRRMPFSEFSKLYSTSMAKVIIAQGEPKIKKLLYDRVYNAGYSFENIIHPLANVSKTSTLGNGILIKPGAIISADAVIEDDVSIEEYVVISHDSIIRKHAQISAFVMIAGHCEIGEGTYIAINVPVRDRVKIGNNSVIGMGSFVIKNVPDNVTAWGRPAKVIEMRTEESRVFR